MSPDSTIKLKTQDTTRTLGRQDAVLLTLAFALMAVYWYVHSHDKMFWGDELMGWLVMREPTVPRMMHEWWAGLDSGSLLFMLFGREWMAVIGPSELSLRASSALMIAISFFILWVSARRFYSVWIVAFCLPVVYLFHETLSWQLSNGRMYGGFMAASALAVYAFLRADPAEPLTARVLWLTFAAHLFLLSSHILGPLYSGAFIAGLVAQDLYARRLRVTLYLSALAAWPVLLLTYKNTIGTMALAKGGGYWTTRPGLRDILPGAVVFDPLLMKEMRLLIVLAVGLTLLFRSSKVVKQEGPQTSLRPIYFVLGIFACILALAWVVSQVTSSIYFNRYLLPVTLADALLMCELVRHILKYTSRRVWVHIVLAAVGVVYFARGYVRHLRHPFVLPYANYTAELVAKDSGGMPMVITDYMMYAEMQFYQHDHATIVMWQDWPMVLASDFGPGGAAGPHEMDNWKQAGFWPDRILPTQELLSRYPNFLIINEPQHTNWFQHYIVENSRYKVTPQPKFRNDDVWLVQTKPGM